jgi:hypothetical protein
VKPAILQLGSDCIGLRTEILTRFYVLEGEFAIPHNERNSNAITGAFTHIQRGVVHKYKNIGKATGKLLVTGVTAGLNFFEEAGIPIADEKSFTPPSSPTDIARIVDVTKKHGIYYVPELQK